MKKLPKNLINITNSKLDTDYTMPENYTNEFISKQQLEWTIAFYKANGLGEYLQDVGIDNMKSVHIYKSLYNVCK